MFPLLMKIFCSTSIALILRYNDSKDGNPLILLMGNYFIATLITLVLLAIDGDISISAPVLGFGAIMAFFFVFSFFAFARAVSAAGTALATVSSRISVLIPILLSIFIYSDIPTSNHIIGFVFAFATIVLFYFSLKNNQGIQLKASEFMYLLILFVGIGVCDFGMKIFQQQLPATDKSLFLLAIFGFSFVYTSAIVLFKKIPVAKPALMRGAVLGIPNVFSSYFLIGALAAVPAHLVFPMANIGIILLTSILAIIIWKEKLNFFGKLSLVSGMISIALLTI